MLIRKNYAMFIEDLAIAKHTVLVRVDYNVPVVDGKITDPRRIDLTFPTINYLLEKNCKIILFSHLGRPQTINDQKVMSLQIVSEYLNQKLSAPVFFCQKNVGPETKKAVHKLNHGEILLLENTRFNDITAEKESIPSLKLAKFWASLADFYLFDAFATAHRLHTSTFTTLNLFPKRKRGYGYLVKKELAAYRRFFDLKARPFVVIIGGGKPDSKLPLIAKIARWVDKIIVCGALAYPFLKIQGFQMGKNSTNLSVEKAAQKIYQKYHKKLVFPLDFQTTKKFSSDQAELKRLGQLQADDLCLDCGPNSLTRFYEVCKSAQAIFWNGPPGVFEREVYADGTKGIMHFLADLAQHNSEIVLGGGDSASAASQFGYLNAGFSHISTGGGASLILIQKEDLPVLTALGLKL